MGIKAKILKELQKKPRRLKELKAKLGNDKKVARAVDELVERNKVVCRKGVYAVPDPKTGNAVECTLVKLAGKFGFARPVQPDGQDIFIPGKYLMGAMPGDTLLVSLFEHPRVEGSSEGEVLAMTVERDVEDCYKAEYMRRFEGEEFDGVISSITQFGLYVELPNTVEGLVRAQALSENALTLTEGVALRDILSGREWRLGGVMRVRVAGVDVSQGNVDFVPAQEQ